MSINGKGSPTKEQKTWAERNPEAIASFVEYYMQELENIEGKNGDEYNE